MASSSLHVAAAAVAVLVILSVHSTGFAVPQYEPMARPSTFGKVGAPALNSGLEPRTNTVAEIVSSKASSMFALSAAVGMAMGARSRMGRLATKSPEEMYKAVIAVGDGKLAQSVREVVISGIVTGFYIGFGGVLCSTVGGAFVRGDAAIQKFLFGAVGFPLSIFLTTIAGGQGFTPNVSVMATAFMDDRKKDRFQKMFANLSWAYLGNAIGLLTIAYLANAAALPAVPAAIEIAKKKVTLSFTEALVRGVLGGWLIGLAVWTASAAEEVSSKFVCIWLCISTYVICQYEHCLANIFFVPCAIFAGAKISWGTFLWHSLLPTTIGNFLGGMLMLAGFYRLVYGGRISTWLSELGL